MRHLFTARESGVSRSALAWGERSGRWRGVCHGVYAEGPDDPSALDVARAEVLARPERIARAELAGVLHEVDSITINDGVHVVRRSLVVPDGVTRRGGVPCAGGLQTLVDLAAVTDDLVWEQALESMLRKGRTTVAAIAECLPLLGATRHPGTARIRRVLALRPLGAPPTESLLETLMVQLGRNVPELECDFVRQHVVHNEHDEFVARLDLSLPHIGFFLELDGQGFHGEPVYDSMRETAVIAATGWLPGRFTWHEVRHLPHTTERRLAQLLARARARWAA